MVFDRHVRCGDCGFPIAGAHCFEEPRGPTPASNRGATPRPERSAYDSLTPKQQEILASPKAVAILTDMKEAADAKKAAKAAKAAKKKAKKEAKEKEKREKGWREYFFLNGREPVAVKAPSLRMAQKIAIETYGDDIWPQTQFGE